MKSFVAMNSVTFRRERESSWIELELLVDKIEKAGMRSLDAGELSRLPVVYRSTLSSLSVARSITLDAHLKRYLDNLAKRAYLALYGVRETFAGAAVRFLSRSFPAVVGKFWWAWLIAAVCFVSGTVTGFTVTIRDTDAYYGIVPRAMQQERSPASSAEELRSALYSGEQPGVLGALSLFTTFLFTHNAQIGIASFSTGIFAGIPVFYLLFTNGEMLGALAAVYHLHGLSYEFWAWVLPHGITEIGALILCGAAGLMLAFGIIAPGRHTRRRHLVLVGRRAAKIIAGAVVMFLIAALIEGLFRQMVTDVHARYAVACLSAVVWFGYFGWCFKKRQYHDPE